MIATGLAKTLLSGAVGALAVMHAVARHAAWYVRYQVDGQARDDEAGPGERGERRDG